MFVFVIITSLITFLVLILGTIAYLVSVIIDDSSDDPSATTLGLDTGDFSRTPVSSPVDQFESSINHVNVDELRDTGVSCNCLKAIEANSAAANQARVRASKSVALRTAQTGANLDGAATGAAIEADPQLLQGAALLASAAAVLAGPEEIQSAEMNSRLLKACDSQREAADVPAAKSTASQVVALDDSSTPAPAVESAGISSWHSSASAQKNIIASQLGSVASKQIFDDLDGKEMQLGGTALHWCKTRKSLDRLLKLGLPVDIVNKRHETALHVAIRKHKLQVLIGLLNHGANLESRNDLGETPLILACKVNDIFAAQLLLIYDANFDAVDQLKQSARHHSATICDRHQEKQQLPSAAHLILAMLNEIGAKRCAPIKNRPTPATGATIESQSAATNPAAAAAAPPSHAPEPGHSRPPATCTDGCAHSGNYNGNSYGRWPNFASESLYKRCMFADIIETKRRELAAATAAAESGRGAGQPANQQIGSRLISMDGGGLRGVIICQIMIEMEKYLKRPVLSYFDWVGGTSVGAFIACALCLGSSLHEMRRVCFEFKDEVFSGGRPYNSKFLERVLKRTYGVRTRLSEVRNHKLAFATVLADREPCQLKMFRNYKSPTQMLEDYGFSSDHYNNMSGHTAVSMSGRRNTVHRISGQVSRADARVRATSSTTCGVGNRQMSKDVDTTSSRSSGQEPMVAMPDQRSQKKPTEADSERSGKLVDVMSSDDGTGVAESKVAKQNTKLDSIPISSVKEVAATSTIDSVLDENDRNPIVWQAVRASAAAPFFFKPYGPYLDGGIIANNPTLDLLTEFVDYHRVRKFIRRSNRSPPKTLDDEEYKLVPGSSDKLDIVVSLGTGRGRVIGRQAMVDFGQIASGLAAVFSPVELVRSIRAARDLFKRLMQQSCHTDDHILDRAQAWCSSLDVPYFRLNPPLATIFSIDDKRDEQLINALWQTKLYMLSMKDQLIELAELLDGAQSVTCKEPPPVGATQQQEKPNLPRSSIPRIVHQHKSSTSKQ